MRREMILVAGVVMLAAGCGKGGMFSAHNDRVAVAAGQELSAEQLATFLTTNKNTKANLTPEAVDFVANLWVDYTLYAQALATKKLTTDSALIAESMWPMIAERQATEWRDSLVAQRVKVSDASIDSAYKEGTRRVGQHILILVDSSTPAAQKAAARKKLEGLLAQVKAGANFGALAMANSEDRGSAADSGMMPPAVHTDYVKPFSDALWNLKPGEVSGIVTTEYGYHIVRYPTEPEAMSHWRTFLSSSGQAAVEQAYYAELEKDANIKVQAGSVARMRAALADMEGKRKDNSKLVSWKGGAFTTADFVRWVKAATTDPMQGPQTLEKIKAAPDSQFTEFARTLAKNSLLLADAEKHKIGMRPEDWKAMQDGFRTELDTIQMNLGLGPDVLDPKASTSDRSKAAALKVDQYFDNLVKGQARLRFLPGMMAWALRGRMSHEVSAVGAKRAIELAQAKLAADSTSPAGALPPAGMEPAPGGAPLPNDNGTAKPVPPTGGTKKP